MKIKDLSLLLEMNNQETKRVQMQRARLTSIIRTLEKQIDDLQKQVFSCRETQDFKAIADFNRWSIQKIARITQEIHIQEEQLEHVNEDFQNAIREEKKIEILLEKMQTAQKIKKEKAQEEMSDFLSLVKAYREE